MIPLMFILGQMDSGIITPPGTVPSTCVSGCTTPLPEIRNSSGDIVNIGDFWIEQGGYYSGLFTLTGNEVYALIISPKNIGQIDNVLHAADSSKYQILSYFNSTIDGKKNTDDAINFIIANNYTTIYPLMAVVLNKRTQNVGGFNDWYIPSEQETVLLLRYFKPDNNCTNFNSTSCNGQIINTKNLFPCNVCNLSSINISNIQKFTENGSESIKNTVGSGLYAFTTTAKNSNLGNGFRPFVFYFSSTYVNYFSISSYSTTFNNNNSTRLVRRVLVS